MPTVDHGVDGRERPTSVYCLEPSGLPSKNTNYSFNHFNNVKLIEVWSRVPLDEALVIIGRLETMITSKCSALRLPRSGMLIFCLLNLCYD